ncbi:MAG: hypothetical protein IH914_07000 [candidate division Zixibacteria bacterium]|nr:hypothetical protein [candidate division Zixibacteria bacterium]
MWTWLLTSISILTLTIMKLVNIKKTLKNVVFVFLGLVGIISAFLSYRENNELSEKLGQIYIVEAKIDSLRVHEETLISKIDNLDHGVDSLLARRDNIKSQIHSLSLEHHSLISINDSLLRLSQTHLSGVLVGYSRTSTLTDGGDYETTWTFRSRWAQDIQNVSVFLEFDEQFVRAVIEQLSSSSILNISCQTREFVGPSKVVTYSCDYLAKGNFLKLSVFSEQPISVTKSEFQPMMQK